MSKPAQERENARTEKRTVRVKLTVIEGRNGKEIITELMDDDLELFNERDFEDFPELLEEQRRSKANFEKRKNKDRPPNERTIAKGDRVRVEEYVKEPDYIHAGIHLLFRTRDEIQWFSDQKINFVIDVAADPELVLVDRDLTPDATHSKEFPRTSANNPFENPGRYPLVCVNGKSVFSGALKLKNNAPDPDVEDQRYYKFNVEVMGTPIILDPHFEAHDD